MRSRRGCGVLGLRLRQQTCVERDERTVAAMRMFPLVEEEKKNKNKSISVALLYAPQQRVKKKNCRTDNTAQARTPQTRKIRRFPTLPFLHVAVEHRAVRLKLI